MRYFKKILPIFIFIAIVGATYYFVYKKNNLENNSNNEVLMDSSVNNLSAENHNYDYNNANSFELDKLVVKFNEDLVVRLKHNQLIPQQVNGRLGLRINNAFARFNLLLKDQGITVARRFSLSEKTLEENKDKFGLAIDLNSYYIFNADRKVLNKLMPLLSSFGIVEEYYYQPKTQNLIIEDVGENKAEQPATNDYSSWQLYLSDANGGLGINQLRSYTGGYGEGIKIYDIEGGWNLNHVDLPQPVATIGANNPETEWQNHGTEVMGLLVGLDNNRGIIGLVPQAQIGLSSVMDNGEADAILNAAEKLSAGDVILIEVQAPGPKVVNDRCTCNCQQFGFVPVEYWSDSFAAIKYATSKGIIVIENSGNGSVDLDDNRYAGAFNINNKNSGAIIVTGTDSNSEHYKLCWTNTGSRIDLNLWGANIVTTGQSKNNVGDASNPDNSYVSDFGGSSGASALAAGSVALIQSIYKNNKANKILSSSELLKTIKSTGIDLTKQKIGYYPILPTTVNALLK